MEDLVQEIGGEIPLFPFVLLHLPIREPILIGFGRGAEAGLVVPHFLVISKEIVPLVVALVLAATAAVVPAVVLNPLPP